MATLNIVNAKKNYGSLWALKGIDLVVNSGEFFGLLGPNGAGKTTLIQSIVGLCRLNEGKILIDGHDVRSERGEALKLIGYSPQDVNLDRFFPIKKILFYQAGFYGIVGSKAYERVDELLEQFKLKDKADLPYYRLSGGMQKRLLVAKAMVGYPRVLILDEPTAGVDVEQRHELWEYLKNLNNSGTTIILTTHYIDEAETLCERIAFIHSGLIRETGTPESLINSYCEKRVLLQLEGDIKSVQLDGFSWDDEKKSYVGRGSDTASLIKSVYMGLSGQPNLKIKDLVIDRGNLEDVFLKVNRVTPGV